jgi:hypothetical protein
MIRGAFGGYGYGPCLSREFSGVILGRHWDAVFRAIGGSVSTESNSSGTSGVRSREIRLVGGSGRFSGSLKLGARAHVTNPAIANAVTESDGKDHKGRRQVTRFSVLPVMAVVSRTVAFS